MSRHWLWVAHDDSFVDAHGNPRNLRPGYRAADDDWWTCHPDTKPNDLFLLYWAGPPHTAIEYLFRATSSPRTRRRRGSTYPGADRKQGHSECAWECIAVFGSPLRFRDMRSDLVVAAWPPYKLRFQGTVFEVPTEVWSRLTTMLAATNHGFGEALTALE